MSPDEFPNEGGGRELLITSTIGWYLWVILRVFLRIVACFCGVIGEAGELLAGVYLEAAQIIQRFTDRPIFRRQDGKLVRTARDVISSPRPSTRTAPSPLPVLLPPAPADSETVSCVRPRFSLGPEGSVRVTYETTPTRLTRRLTTSPTTIEEIDSSVPRNSEGAGRSATVEPPHPVLRSECSSQTSVPSASPSSNSSLHRTVGDFVPSPNPACAPRRRSPRRQHPEETIS